MRSVLLVLLLALPLRAESATLYVQPACPAGATTYDPDTRDCAQGQAAAYATIQSAIDAMDPGGTVLIAGGTYAEAPVLSSAKSGREGAPTTVAAVPGETVVLLPTAPNAGGTAFWNYASYSTVERLTVDGSQIGRVSNLVLLGEGSGAVYHHITVRDVEIRNQHGQDAACLTSAGNASAHHDFLLERLNIHHCGLDMTVFNPGGHCLYIGNSRVTVQDSELSYCATMGIQLYKNPTDITLRRLHVHHTGATGILSYDPRVTIEDVTIDHFGQDVPHYGQSAGIKQVYNGTSVFRRNRVSAGPVGIWTAMEGTATVSDNTISEVTTNVRDDGTSNVFTNNACQPADQYCTGATPTPPETPTVPLATGLLSWQWAPGPPPNDGAVETWQIHCGQAAGESAFTDAQADPTLRARPLREFLPGPGEYYCRVHGWNLAGLSEASPETHFIASALSPPAPPTAVSVELGARRITHTEVP